MEQEPSNQKSKGSIANYLWLLSISVGLAIGAGIGAAIDRIGAGIGVGLVFGVILAIAIYRWLKSNSSID